MEFSKNAPSNYAEPSPRNLENDIKLILATGGDFPASHRPRLVAQVARLLTRNLHLVTLRDTGEILYYDSGIYIPGGEAKIAQIIEGNFATRELDYLVTNVFVAETIGHVKRRTYHDRADFDKDPLVLNLRNGLLDLRTFKFRKHTPEHLSLVQLPVTHDPNANCPRIRKFLSEILYKNDIPVMQEYVGYTLWKDYPTAKALMLIGDGSNGKSTFLSLIKTLYGQQNISSRSLQDLESNRFARADLFGKMANICGDLPDEALRSAGTFKMLTGRDPMTAERKFQNGFTFTNYAKLIFSANRLPEVFDDSTAFFRRWILVTFPNTFMGEAEDPNLLQKLTSDQELSGFLNWALEGLRRLQANGWDFTNSVSVEQVREDYMRKSSPIEAFIMDCATEKTDGQVPKQELYAAFCEYCRQVHLPTVTSDTFSKNLPRHVRFEEARVQIHGRRQHCLRGLELKPKNQWPSRDGKIHEQPWGGAPGGKT